MNPFEAIQYVTGALTLIAFLVAVAAWLYRSWLRHRVQLVRETPSGQRPAVVGDILGHFRVDTAGLTKQQQYDIAIRQIEGRAERFRMVCRVGVLLAVILAIITMIAIWRQPDPTPGTDSTTLGAYRDHLITSKASLDIDLTGNAGQRHRLNNLRVQKSLGDYRAVLAQICKTEERCINCEPLPQLAQQRMTITIAFDESFALAREQMPGRWPIPSIVDGKPILEDWEDVDEQGNRYWYVCRQT